MAAPEALKPCVDRKFVGGKCPPTKADLGLGLNPVRHRANPVVGIVNAQIRGPCSRRLAAAFKFRNVGSMCSARVEVGPQSDHWPGGTGPRRREAARRGAGVPGDLICWTPRGFQAVVPSFHRNLTSGSHLHGTPTMVQPNAPAGDPSLSEIPGRPGASQRPAPLPESSQWSQERPVPPFNIWR